MALVYLVRHGQTEWNLAGKMQGKGDSPLTELGREQALTAADELKDAPISKCYHSAMIRTKQTAEILVSNHKDIPVEANPEFMEIGFGQWEGSVNSRSDHKVIRSEEETELHHFWFAPEKYKGAENSESFYELTDRMYDGVKKVNESHGDDEVILIVSHCASIRSFLNKCLGRDMKDFWAMPKTMPASVSLVKWDKDQAPVVLRYSGHDAPEK